MSSSDDSDVCDFSSNIQSVLDKRSKKFKKTFLEKTTFEPEASGSKLINEKEDSVSTITIDNKIKLDNVITLDDKKCSDVECVVENKINEHSDVEILDVSNCEDVQASITDKLNKLQEVVTRLLHDGKRGVGRPRGGRGRSSRTRSNRNILSQILQGISTPPRGRRSGRLRNVRTPQTSNNILSETITIEDDVVEIDINPIVMVTIEWQSTTKQTFKVKKFQRLDVIFDFYLKKSGASPKLLFFTLNDKEVNLNENSYVSLKLSENNSIIEGAVLPDNCVNREIKSKTNVAEPGSIRLKVQLATIRSKQLEVFISPTDKMEIALWQVLSQLGLEIGNIRLYLDGSAIKPHETVESLDLEEDDCLDLVLIDVESK